MSTRPRTIVEQMFRRAGVRVALSRETISRLTGVAYPTLDPVLTSLVADGLLEINTWGNYVPARTFSFEGSRDAERESKRLEKQRRREELKALHRRDREERRAMVRTMRESREAERAAALIETRAARLTERAATRAEKIRRKKELDEARAAIRALKFTPTPRPPRKPPPAPPPPPEPAPPPARAPQRPVMPSEPSALRPLTRFELMTGRRARHDPLS